MTEKICTEGHVIDEGKEICSRCGGSAPVVESNETPVEEAVVNEEAIEVEVPAEEEISNEAVEYDGPMGKYKVIGEIFPLNEDGSKQDVALEIGSIHELPKPAGDQMVAEGTMEEVVEENNESSEEASDTDESPLG